MKKQNVGKALSMKMNEKPAIITGKPTFRGTLPIVQPPIKAHIESILADCRRILESGMITNFEYVRKLEKTAAEYIGVKRCLAAANCTSALMLTLKALKIKDGEVLIPSFTFPATAHAVYWSNLGIKLVDCDPKKFTIDINDIKEKITDKTKVIMPVHVFGNPCDIEEITEIAKERSLRVVYDSAHGFGAKYKGKQIGQFGDAEVFSGSPTKAFTTVEGGIVSTNDSEIARSVDIGRNYGHSGNYNCAMPGLSARMSELHAAVGLNQLPYVDSDIQKRNKIATMYKHGLERLPGIKFQEINRNCISTYKDFSILVDQNQFGLDRDELSTALEKENIMTRKYFYPPMNMQDCYPELKAEENAFPNTSEVSRNVLSLPMFSELTDQEVIGVVDAIARIQTHASEVHAALSKH